MKNKIAVMLAIILTVCTMSEAFAFYESYPCEVNFDKETIIWDSGAEIEIQRLSPNEEWTTVYCGSDGMYTDNAPDGLNYYRVREAGEKEWKYSYGRFAGKKEEAVYAWKYYESNTSGKLEYTSELTNYNTYRIAKLSEYASGDYCGIMQQVSPDKLEKGKSYTLSFEHKRMGGVTSYNQIYYSLGGLKISITPQKGQSVDWKTTSRTFTCNDINNFNLCFYIAGAGVSLELRNIKLYESSDEAQANILENGDFAVEKIQPDAPDNAALLSENVLSWTADNGITVYDAITGYPLAIYSADKCIGSLLKTSDAYTVRAYSENEMMSEPYMLTYKDKGFVTAPQFSRKAADGAAAISINIKNTNEKEGLPIGFYTAIYCSGKLSSVMGMSQVVPYTRGDNTFTIMQTECDVPDDAEYEIKAFIWSGLEAMKPITVAKGIK